MEDKDRPEEKGIEETGDGQAEKDDEIVESSVDQIQVDLEKARLEAADYLDSLQRLKADFDNFRKRMLREQSEFLKLASQTLIGALLPVIDNFERALEHEMHGDQLDKYRDGLRLVYSQILDVLAKEGLSVLEPVGQQFDPNQHEAVLQEESSMHEEGTVVRVLEKGYVLKARVIRPAKVVVAK